MKGRNYTFAAEGSASRYSARLAYAIHGRVSGSNGKNRMLPIVTVDRKKAQKMEGMKLAKTTRTLSTTASTSPARVSHGSASRL